MTTRQAIDEMVSRIVRRFDPEKVILFGSQARGDAGPDSDVDLAVVMPVSGSKRRKTIDIRLELHEIAVPKDIVVLTPDEFDRFGAIPGTVARELRRDGKVLYERRH